jgi:hypothetical protein
VTSTGTSTASAPAAPAIVEATTGHRWLKLLAIVIVLVLIAELLTRLIDSHLPAPLQWDTYETQRKVQQIDALAQKGGADMVYVGSSIVDVGIDPATVDRQFGRRVTSYNAGLVSSIPRMTTDWTEDVVVPKLHPKVVVLGLSSYDLGAEDPNRTVFLNSYLASSGARQVMHTNDPIQNVNQWLGQHSALWFHKAQLRDPATVLHALEGHTPAQDPEAAAVAPDGRQTLGQYTRYNPNISVDLQGWRLGSKDIDAVRQLIAFDSARHITTVLVDMPVTKQLVDQMPHGESSYRVFTNEVAAIGSATHSPVLNDADIRDQALFYSDVHLNHTGAELFSIALGDALKKIDPDPH